MPQPFDQLASGPLMGAGSPRVGNVAAMLRLMQPLHGAADPVVGRRRLLADLCRFIGTKLVPPPEVEPPPLPPASEPTLRVAVDDLTPRLAQTLQYLLSGASEKQAARLMNLSHHTVHGHVKTLYRRYGVSTRAELLAYHLRGAANPGDRASAPPPAPPV